MDHTKVWYVTGASKGLGLSLVKRLIQNGYKVAATTRHIKELNAAIGHVSVDQFLPLQVDLTDTNSIAASIQKTDEYFGHIDVVVNNAGYGIGGAIEELAKDQIVRSFEINVFATIDVIKSVLPYMRNQRSGHILNISSIAGFAPHIGWSIYAATKFSIMGLTEVLAQDVKPLGINVTLIAPGGFRTQFNKKESLDLPGEKISDYQQLHDAQQDFIEAHGKQLGDPDKAADIFIEVVESPNPPNRLFLGSDAYQRAAEKLDQLRKELKVNKSLSTKTDFNNG